MDSYAPADCAGALACGPCDTVRRADDGWELARLRFHRVQRQLSMARRRIAAAVFCASPGSRPRRFLLAMAIHPEELGDLAALAGERLGIVGIRPKSPGRGGVRQFIQQSGPNSGSPKRLRGVPFCGWFSDRSVCYLASGRPVIAQDTGFIRFLPTGAGLFAFRTSEDVLTAIDANAGRLPAALRGGPGSGQEYFDFEQGLDAIARECDMTPTTPELKERSSER